MAQRVTRLDDRLVAANRPDAVRLGFERLVDERGRRRIGAQLVDAYRRQPQTDEELGGLDAATRSVVAEEPW